MTQSKHVVVYQNEEFNEEIKKSIFTYSLLYTTPSDYLRQIFMTCGSGYDYNPTTGEIECFENTEYETEMKYPEVSEYVVETMIRDAQLKFVAENIDRVIEDFTELRDLDGYSPVEMYVRNWTKSTLFFKMAKLVLNDQSSVKNMTDRTMAALSMFCKWVVDVSQRGGIVYMPEDSKIYKGHGSYNVPDGFPEFVTTASLVYKTLDSEYRERHDIQYNASAIEQILEILNEVGKE